MQITNNEISNITYKSQPFRLPIKTISYNSEFGKVTKNVNFIREFSDPKAGFYYQKLQDARKKGNIEEAKTWRLKMGDFKLIDRNEKSLFQIIKKFLSDRFKSMLEE